MRTKSSVFGIVFSGLMVLTSSFSFAEQSSLNVNATSAGGSAITQESKASLKEALKPKKFEENTQITDAQMKADGGSLSRYSVKLNMSYYGPTVNDLSVDDQPNPDGSAGVYATSVKGSLSARYRMDSQSAISAGSGLNALYPRRGFERVDVNNPYVNYDMSKRYGQGDDSFQMKNSLGVNVTTVPNYRDAGQVAGLNHDFSLVKDISDTRFAVQMDSSFGYFIYNRDYTRADKKVGRYNWGLFPGAKYNFSDKLNVNTSVAINFWNPREKSNELVIWNKTVSQRLGLGYAFTRDIYFAPYVNFYPKRLAMDTTTVNFSTVFSVF